MNRIEDQYLKLVYQILDQKIQIKADPATDSGYFVKGRYPRSDKNFPTIIIKRTQGSDTIFKKDQNDVIQKFINTSPNLLIEIIILAHEFGHHFSKFKNFEEIREKFYSDRINFNFNSRISLFYEEIFAWSKAFTFLRTVGFYHPIIFFKTTIHSLFGYFMGYFWNPIIFRKT